MTFFSTKVINYFKNYSEFRIKCRVQVFGLLFLVNFVVLVRPVLQNVVRCLLASMFVFIVMSSSYRKSWFCHCWLFICTKDLCSVACGILVPNQRWNPRSLHWKLRVLTTGPPGKSQHKNIFKSRREKTFPCRL